MGDLIDLLLEHTRKALEGMSLNKLAEATSVDVASLHRWLKGERSISLDNADKLATYFGLTLRPKGRQQKVKKRPPQKRTSGD